MAIPAMRSLARRGPDCPERIPISRRKIRRSATHDRRNLFASAARGYSDFVMSWTKNFSTISSMPTESSPDARREKDEYDRALEHRRRRTHRDPRQVGRIPEKRNEFSGPQELEGGSLCSL